MVKVKSNADLAVKVAVIQDDWLSVEEFLSSSRISNEDELTELLKHISKIVDKSSILRAEIGAYLAHQAFGEKGVEI